RLQCPIAFAEEGRDDRRTQSGQRVLASDSAGDVLAVPSRSPAPPALASRASLQTLRGPVPRTRRAVHARDRQRPVAKEPNVLWLLLQDAGQQSRRGRDPVQPSLCRCSRFYADG